SEVITDEQLVIHGHRLQNVVSPAGELADYESEIESGILLLSERVCENPPDDHSTADEAAPLTYLIDEGINHGGRRERLQCEHRRQRLRGVVDLIELHAI